MGLVAFSSIDFSSCGQVLELVMFTKLFVTQCRNSVLSLIYVFVALNL